MTMVSDDRRQRPPPVPGVESVDGFDDAVAWVRANLDQVTAGLDTLEAQQQPDALPG